VSGYTAACYNGIEKFNALTIYYKATAFYVGRV